MRTYTGVAAALSVGFSLVNSAPCSGGSPLLYVATYPKDDAAGKVTTLQLGASSLKSLSTSDGCGPYPSWLTQAGDLLYCVDEAWGVTAGTLSSLKIGDDGALTKLNSIPTLRGPVSTIIYGDGGRGLAVAN